MSSAVILEALADAFDAAGHSLRQHVDVIRAHEDADADRGPRLSAVSKARAMHPHLGSRQAEVVEVLEAAGAEGTNTGAISREIGYDQPNVYLTLRGLGTLGFVEKDDTTTPHTYRLTPILLDDEGAGGSS